MTQPPTPERGPGQEPARDPRLAAFAENGAGDTLRPSAAFGRKVSPAPPLANAASRGSRAGSWPDPRSGVGGCVNGLSYSSAT